MLMTQLLVGTKKGLFVLEGAAGGPFEVPSRAFAGEPVEFAFRDPRNGRYFACVTSAFYGPKLFFTDDPADEWRQAEGIALPEDEEQAMTRLWGVSRAKKTGFCTREAIRASSSRAATAVRAGSSTRRSGSSPPGRNGAPARAACACTRSRRGRATLRESRSPSPLSASGSPTTVGRPGDMATRVSSPLHAGGGAGGHVRSLRSQHAPCPVAAGPALHAVSRRRLPLGRRRARAGRHRGRAPVGLRLPVGDRPGRPRQRLRDPARRGPGPHDARGSRAGLRDARRGCELGGARRRPPRRGRVSDDLPPSVLPRRLGRDMELYFGATSGDVFGSNDAGATWFTAAANLPPVHSVRVA